MYIRTYIPASDRLFMPDWSLYTAALKSDLPLSMPAVKYEKRTAGDQSTRDNNACDHQVPTTPSYVCGGATRYIQQM